MTKQTIIQLNQLNRIFYDQVADEFDETRKVGWPGWKQLTRLLRLLESEHPTGIQALDVGCGNGRFLSFLDEHLTAHSHHYIGCDSSNRLLATAAARQTRHFQHQTFFHHDLIQDLLESAFVNQFSQRFHLITAFGLLHHIPSAPLRAAFFEACRQLLEPQGLFVVTAWQFDQSDRLIKRAVNPATMQIDATQLEQNDFILDWQRGTKAVRYCHLTTEQELETLAHGAGFRIQDRYDADGHEGTLNKYMLLKT